MVKWQLCSISTILLWCSYISWNLQMYNCLESLEFSVMEEQPRFTSIGQIHHESPANARYSLLTGQSSNMFLLHPRTSQLSTSVVLDRDAICPSLQRCELYLTAALVEPRSNFTVFPVKVQLMDKNDNTAAFPDKQYHVDVEENTAIGKTFQLPQAFDLDSPEFSSLVYKLKSGTKQTPTAKSDATAMPFSLEIDEHNRPLLMVSDSLDRETKSGYTVYLVVTGSSGEEATLDIYVNIVDINEHPPIFDTPTMTFNISEDLSVNSTIYTALATDLDLQSSSTHVIYQVDQVKEKLASSTLASQEFLDHSTSNGMFSVDRNSGEVRLSSQLDRERVAGYSFRVVASDTLGGAGSRHAYQMVNIEVGDVNDNPPRVTLNGFTMNQDLEGGELSGHVEVVAADVDENLAAGAFVAFGEVTDSDSGRNSMVNCRVEVISPEALAGVDGYFSVATLDNDQRILQGNSRVQFKLVTSRILDREQVVDYKLGVWCEDSGVPSLRSNTTFLVVRVKDRNDNGPSFPDSRRNLDIMENTATGQPIGDRGQRVEDKDETIAPVIYELIWPDELSVKPPISVHPITGQFISNGPLDFESDPRSFTVTVLATDLTGRNASYQLNIGVVDLNDESPMFKVQERTSLVVAENAMLGTRVGQAWTAHDKDVTPEFALHTFSIGQAGEVPFSVHPTTGQLTVSGPIDRETVDRYTLTLVVTDVDSPDLYDTLKLDVFIDDVNDNRPVFRVPSEPMLNITTAVSVIVDTSIGVIVYTLAAYDLDTNADLWYNLVDARQGGSSSLVSDASTSSGEEGSTDADASSGIVWNNDLFSVDPILGNLKTTRELDLSDVDRTYVLIVKVTDGYYSIETRIHLRVVASQQAFIMTKGSGRNTLVIALVLSLTCILIITLSMAIVVVVKRRSADRANRMAHLDGQGTKYMCSETNCNNQTFTGSVKGQYNSNHESVVSNSVETNTVQLRTSTKEIETMSSTSTDSGQCGDLGVADSNVDGLVTNDYGLVATGIVPGTGMNAGDPPSVQEIGSYHMTDYSVADTSLQYYMSTYPQPLCSTPRRSNVRLALV